MKTLEHRIALVTGASRGLGKAIALELCNEGVTLALIGRDEAKLKETALEAERLGTAAHVFVVDVTQEPQVQALARQIESRFRACGHPRQQRGDQCAQALGQFHAR